MEDWTDERLAQKHALCELELEFAFKTTETFFGFISQILFIVSEIDDRVAKWFGTLSDGYINIPMVKVTGSTP